MAESTLEVKLVRCPKCKNLLPEPRDCSFFQCGGCGTVLCAKNKDREADPEPVKSMKNRGNETEVNYVSSGEESDSSRHQQTGQTETTWDDVPFSKLNIATGSQPGLNRSRKTEGFRFSASNYFTDSISSDEAIQQDRAELVRKLDKLKEHHLLQPKEQQHIPRPSSGFKKAPPLRFPSSGKHVAGPYYHQTNQQQSHHHYSRQYTGTNSDDLFNTHPGNGMMLHHQSTCSCFHCYDPYHRASGSVYPPSGLPDALHNISFYPYERTSTAFPSPLHSPRSFIPPPVSQSRGLDALKNAISRVRAAKAVSSSGGTRLIHPVAGGAPFINCRKCSKILKLPDKTTRKQQRLRCGGCSCLIDLSFADKKLIHSTDDPASTREEEEEETLSRLHWVTGLDVSSDAMDGGPDYVSTGPASISDKAHDYSTSPSFSEDELSSESPTTGRKLIPDFDYSSINVRDRSGARSQSSRSEQNRVSLGKTVMRQNSMNEASVLIEMDVNDYSHNNNGVSQDSEEDGRSRKGGFGSMVKNSFKDLKKSMQNEGGSDVVVNGHLVAERLVKMAEKQAGPIRPGNYWYDYRAGFWGIMGGQCLGILPPFIEELNYPMPENCAGGTTGVFVNGRELHQKDLRLLIARGLPRDRDRSYTVYITGRVIDEDTGEELNSLGKLAPTVDKLKRGFGMRVPRRYA
ncbi:zinc_ribbon_12 domain-containing protein [Hirschfeldia incana]|nr:zinc_ribbon_12 domain-containing protein [Hirschfeldia incana]